VGGVPQIGMSANMGLPGQQQHTPGLEIRQDEDGNIVGGARVLGPMSPRQNVQQGHNGEMAQQGVVPVLPKVQRNSASRLPFLMEILPRLMNITKETTPVEIRECLLREYGAEVHLQQCRRAKTEILKKRAENGGVENQVEVTMRPSQSLDGMGSESAGDGNSQLFGPNDINNGNPPPSMNGNPPNTDPHFQLHTASGVVIPQVPTKREAALNAVGEQPVRCPYCVNHRWMTSIKDAVEHMSMHVVV
jgi:hypothetical protein